MMVDYYTIIAVVLFSSSVMATQHNAICTCTRYGLDVDNPGVSCADIYDNNPASHGKSGYYVVKTDHVHTVYCDMELECGGQKGGWMKIADYDTSRGDNCPKGWNKITANSVAMCRSPSDSAGCYPTKFSVHNVAYSKICGKLKGYQKHSTDAFGQLFSSSIDTGYVDGISITLGSPCKHVWTYAVGFSDSSTYNGNDDQYNCPCAKRPGTAPPAFVGSHYYCESGIAGVPTDKYYTSDPLWDGSGCSVGNNCCANTNQPWFFRQLVMKTQDDIEARLCTDQVFGNEGVLVQQIQLYVH